MNVLLDITLFCCMLFLLYWLWLTVKYLYAAGTWLGHWLWYRFIPVVNVEFNGVFVGRITQKEHDDMILKIEKWEEIKKEMANDR